MLNRKIAQNSNSEPYHARLNGNVLSASYARQCGLLFNELHMTFGIYAQFWRQ